MKKSKTFLYKRLMWYFIGFVLFYAPFAVFQRLLSLVIHTEGRHDIHEVCLRCGLLGILGGIKTDILSIRIVVTLFLLTFAFLMGPIFCRFFCVTGAVTEYLSKIVPNRLKVNWQKYVSPVPVKYGILTGFLLTPLLGLSVACAFCNYSLFQRMTLGLSNMDIGVLSSTNILTLFVWFVILGVFSKGGRGFCSYLCPVGAAQSLMHSVGKRFKFTHKLIYNAEKCSSCGICSAKCPMGAIKSTKEGIIYQVHNCITCKQCVNACKNDALVYGTSYSKRKKIEMHYDMNGKENENEIH